jgi:superfamily II DNA or RNA helicase
MKLRQWQSECIDRALAKYKRKEKHFFCLATPGAGKTLMSSVLVQRLFYTEKIDLVLCFSPSINVANDFKSALEQQTQYRIDGLLGSKGRSLTYQSLANLDDEFWKLFDNYKIMVIFDEIHHCSGHSLLSANAWGQKIIQHIQYRAEYTLALSGTPWRSDSAPISLSEYCQADKIQCDYIYGLGQSIIDKVCRIPRITIIDNDEIIVRHLDNETKYSSINELMNSASCSYFQFINNDSVISYMLKKADRKLNSIRKIKPSAGGLVVAASVEHAHKIAGILLRDTGNQASIATYMEDGAQEIINKYKRTNDKWIISVGMISEGTNIPRLTVCCHLTHIKTELHFRQVLGRVLRSQGTANEEGFIYVPAEQKLIDYAHRLSEDIPEDNIVRFDTMPKKESKNNKLDNQDSDASNNDQSKDLDSTIILKSDFPENKYNVESKDTSKLEEEYQSAINVFGRFHSKIIKMNMLPISS